MAVQGNLLGGSDLGRLVAVAQANRPPSLGQLAEARRKERMDSRTKLAEIGLKFAIENRKIDILRQQGADELKLKEADYLNQKQVRESTLRLAVEEAKTKRTRDKAADRLSAHNQFMQDFIKKTGSEGLAVIEFRSKKEMQGIFNALNMGELGFDFEEDYGSFFADSPQTPTPPPSKTKKTNNEKENKLRGRQGATADEFEKILSGQKGNNPRNVLGGQGPNVDSTRISRRYSEKI